MDVVLRDLRASRWSAGLVALAVLVATGCSSFVGTTAASFLRKVETSRDPNERYVAYEKLGSPRAYDDEGQKARAVQVLSKKLDRKVEGREDFYEPTATRAMICRTLGKLGHSEAREAILKAVNDNDPLVRAEACTALGRVGKSEDATVLARTMTADSSPDCRIAAIDAMGVLNSKDPRITVFLANAMEGDEDPAVRLASLNALRKMTGKDLGVEPKAWQEYLVHINPANKQAMTAKNTAPASPTRPNNPQPSDPTVRQASTPR